eukprot:scaffold735_cov376-Prasinococcus_capsulatus_cf.AAC.7
MAASPSARARCRPVARAAAAPRRSSRTGGRRHGTVRCAWPGSGAAACGRRAARGGGTGSGAPAAACARRRRSARLASPARRPTSWSPCRHRPPVQPRGGEQRRQAANGARSEEAAPHRRLVHQPHRHRAAHLQLSRHGLPPPVEQRARAARRQGGVGGVARAAAAVGDGVGAQVGAQQRHHRLLAVGGEHARAEASRHDGHEAHAGAQLQGAEPAQGPHAPRGRLCVRRGRPRGQPRGALAGADVARQRIARVPRGGAHADAPRAEGLLDHHLPDLRRVGAEVVPPARRVQLRQLRRRRRVWHQRLAPVRRPTRRSASARRRTAAGAAGEDALHTRAPRCGQAAAQAYRGAATRGR